MYVVSERSGFRTLLLKGENLDQTGNTTEEDITLNHSDSINDPGNFTCALPKSEFTELVTEKEIINGKKRVMVTTILKDREWEEKIYWLFGMSADVSTDLVLREEGIGFLPKNRFFLIFLNYFLAFSVSKNLFLMSKFSYNYLM